MKITKIEFIEHIVPKGSCSTGYSELDKFHIYGDNDLETNILVENMLKLFWMHILVMNVGLSYKR